MSEQLPGVLLHTSCLAVVKVHRQHNRDQDRLAEVLACGHHVVNARSEKRLSVTVSTAFARVSRGAPRHSGGLPQRAPCRLSGIETARR